MRSVGVVLGLSAAFWACAPINEAPRVASGARTSITSPPVALADVAPPAAEDELEIAWNPLSRVLEGIRVMRAGEPLRELPAHPEVVVMREDDYVAKRLDFDGDAQADLVVYRSAASGDGYVIVWPFDAAAGAFRALPEVYWGRSQRPVRAASGQDARAVGLLRHVKDEAGKRTDIVIFGGGGITQVLHHEGFAVFPGDRWGGELDPSADVDFDGDADLVLLREPCGARCRYTFFRFDHERGRFAWSAELSSLTSPVIDAERRELREFESRGLGGALHRAARYRFEGGRLEKVWESEQTDALPRPADASFTRTVRAREGGQMAIVCHALLDADTNVLKVLKGSLPRCAE